MLYEQLCVLDYTLYILYVK